MSVLAKATAMALSLFILLSGCVAVSFIPRSMQSIRGEGNLVTQSYTLPAYTKVEINGFFDVRYSSVASDGIKIKINESLVPHVEVSVTDGKLLVNTTKIFSTKPGETPTLYLSTPTLEALYISGATQFVDSDPIQGKQFELDVSGASSITLSLDVEELKMDLSGASDVTLDGRAATADIEMSGAATVNAFALDTARSKLDISGSGSCYLHCTDTLDVEISGVGSVEYSGDCTVNQDISGAGSVRKKDA